MRNRKMVKAALIAAGVAAAIAAPAASASAAVASPAVHVQKQVYHGPSWTACVTAVANAEAQYGSTDGFCAWDGFNYNGYVNID